IGLFLFGMLGFRLYAKFSADQSFLRWQALSRLSYIAGAVVLLIIMYFHVWLVQFLERLIDPHLAVLVTYPLFIIAIPVLFLVSGKNGIDRLIGEMSYPVYLVHYLVIVVVANLLNIGPGAELGRISAVASVVLAALMYRKFIAPLDRKRHDLSVKKPIKAH
ncbi:MAG TPA: acyltransferase family protein, partial [Verrucomicrobiae bacterium]|nr:acyltransferase family protein [Verrucomicrobiae bacterium]